MSFADLPESLDARGYADQWPAVRSSLLSLDALTRRLRNGDAPSASGARNYRDMLDFDALLARLPHGGWLLGCGSEELALSAPVHDP